MSRCATAVVVALLAIATGVRASPQQGLCIVATDSGTSNQATKSCSQCQVSLAADDALLVHKSCLNKLWEQF